MSVVFSTLKCCVFGFNIICLILGIGAISISAIGLESAKPGSDEHTNFIVGIILASLVCMTTLFGCYGVVCELLGVTVIYSFFLLMLLVVQYLQMKTFRPQVYYRNAVQNLEDAWRLLETEPGRMQTLEIDYHCCALHNSRDYNTLHLSTPFSCFQHQDVSVPDELYTRGCLEALQLTHQFAAHRDKLFTWALIIVEGIAFLYSVVLGIILFKHDSSQRLHLQPVRGFVEPRTNHVNSRTHLLSN